MDRKPLKSSKLRAAGYDARERLLEIEFVNGDVVEYKGVSSELHRQLMASPSPNSFFEDKIEEAFTGRRVGKISKTEASDAFDALFGGGTGSKSSAD
ncbi:MAG: KTSC domain-containing protein [Burkholderiales bacterium]|nr:KTSC domain-containing protein [Burkholderiales bacterium]